MAKEKRSFYDSKAYKAYKRFMPLLYGIGASIVVIGAYFKITHIKGADLMLGVGLLTEAIIFFFSAFDKPEEDNVEEKYHWENVFPELTKDGSSVVRNNTGISKLIEEGFNNFLKDVKIDNKLIESLNSGLANLKESVDNLNKIGSTAVNTAQFNESISNAIKSADKLSHVYSDAADDFSKFNQGFGKDANISNFVEQIKNVSNNLSALNGLYELQLSNKKVQEDMAAKMEKSYKMMTESLEQSASATVTFKNEAEAMSKKLAALNNIYGNMLSAFNVKG